VRISANEFGDFVIVRRDIRTLRDNSLKIKITKPTHQLHACEVTPTRHTHEVHAYEVRDDEMHAREMYAREVHAYEMHAHEMHAP
jgi:hypothetical protein